MVSLANKSRPGGSPVIRRGQEIYDQKLKAALEPDRVGEFVVIDVETGDFEVDQSHIAAAKRAMAKRPGAKLFVTRVGSPAFARIGLSSETSRP